eukprot:g6368.t1
MAISWGKAKNNPKFYKGSRKSDPYCQDLLWKLHVEQESRILGVDNNKGVWNAEKQNSQRTRNAPLLEVGGLRPDSYRRDPEKALEKQLRIEREARQKLQGALEALMSNKLSVRGRRELLEASSSKETKHIVEQLRRLRIYQDRLSARSSRVNTGRSSVSNMSLASERDQSRPLGNSSFRSKSSSVRSSRINSERKKSAVVDDFGNFSSRSLVKRDIPKNANVTVSPVSPVTVSKRHGPKAFGRRRGFQSGPTPSNDAPRVRGTKKRSTAELDTMGLSALFARVDRNGNGRISIKELGRALADIGEHPGSRQLAMIFRDADEDNDGYINRKEFVHLIRRNQDILGAL